MADYFGSRAFKIPGSNLKPFVSTANGAPIAHESIFAQTPVACQRDGTTVLPWAWDHLDVLASMAGLVSGVKGGAPALAVGGASDDEGVGS